MPGKAKIMYKNFKEALERHVLKIYSYPQDLLDFSKKSIKAKLKEPEEPKGKRKPYKPFRTSKSRTILRGRIFS